MTAPVMPWAPITWTELDRELAGLPPATVGALMRLAGRLWADPACAIPDQPDVLAAACGARREWPVVGEDVRLVLKPHPTEPGALTWPWLHELWQQQRAKLRLKRAAGAKGGKTAQKQKRAAQVVANQHLGSTTQEHHSEAPHGGDAQEHASRAPAVSDTRTEVREPISLPLNGEREIGSPQRQKMPHHADTPGSAVSSSARAPSQGAPPSPPLVSPLVPRYPPEPPANPGWRDAPRVATPVNARPSSIGSILERILPPAIPHP